MYAQEKRTTIINPELFTAANGIVSFLDASTEQMIYENPSMADDVAYLLYTFVRDDFLYNVLSLSTVQVENDIEGFAPVQRNTRHAVESFFDLVNYGNDEAYYNVMEYCNRNKNVDIRKYIRDLYNDNFTLLSKYQIAMRSAFRDKENFKLYYEFAIDSNAFAHPNVRMGFLGRGEVERKRSILTQLLEINLNLISQAFDVLLLMFHRGYPARLGCYPCKNRRQDCYHCFEEEKRQFAWLLHHRIFLTQKQRAYYTKNKTQNSRQHNTRNQNVKMQNVRNQDIRRQNLRQYRR